MQRDHSIPTDEVFSFGVWVSQRRNVLRLTQPEVANLVGCSVVLIRKIEADARRPSAHIAERLAIALHVAAHDIPDFIRAARVEQSPHRLPPPERHSINSPTLLILDVHPRVEGNLPAAVSSFIGRTHTIQELRTLLTRPATRLLTLTGAGGTGKTHLALAVVRPLVTQFPHGVWFVDLAPIADPTQVNRAILHALGVIENSRIAPHESLIAWLRHRHLLLVIDNVEHLLDGAPVISDMLRAAPKLQILATSRVPLRLQGEQEYLVTPLSLPTHMALPIEQLVRAEAIQLFTERATAIQPAFRITAANISAIAEICLHLDGLPLAIELAAVRIRVFTPQQLLTRLKADGLRVLNSGPRDLSARQRTIAATIAWSERLLAPMEQTLFARLGVFVGSFSLPAAEAVGGDDDVDVIDGLEALLMHGLVQRVEMDVTPRFRMLETIRAYAVERLAQRDDEDRVRERYGRYFVACAEATVPHFLDPPDSVGMVLLDQELDNLRAVLRWAVESHRSRSVQAAQTPIELGLRLMIATYNYWEVHAGRAEGHQWLEQLVALAGAVDSRLRLTAILVLTQLHKFFDAPGAWALIQSIESAVAHTDDQQLQYTFACFAGWVETFRDQEEAAIQRWEAALAQAIMLGDLRWNADFHWGIGFAAYYLRRLEQSERHLRECLRLSRMLDSRYLIGETFFWIALIVLERGNKVEGHQLLIEAAAIARRTGNWRTLRSALECLSDLARDAGNLGQTEAIARESLELARREGQIKLMQRLLYRLARVRLAVGDKDAAVALLDQALEADSSRPASIWHPAAALLLGKIHVAYGDIGAARHCYHQSLAATAPDTDPHGAAHVLEVIAALAADLGDPLIGARFWGAAAALRETAAPPVWHPNARFAFESSTGGERHRLEDASWNTAWDAGHALTWEQAADEALAWLAQAAPPHGDHHAA